MSLPGAIPRRRTGALQRTLSARGDLTSRFDRTRGTIGNMGTEPGFPPHPLAAHVHPLCTAVVDALADATGTVSLPHTLAEFDQHEKACDDLESLVADLIDRERVAAAESVIEAGKW